jgi:hypothetical protein
VATDGVDRRASDINGILAGGTKSMGLGEVFARPIKDGSLAEREIQVVEISADDCVTKLVPLALEWQKGGTIHRRDIIFYVAPVDQSPAHEISLARSVVERVEQAGNKRPLGNVSFVLHGHEEFGSYNLEDVVRAAHRASAHQYPDGIPKHRLDDGSAKIAWMKTTERWEKLSATGLSLNGGLKIPASDIVPYLINLTNGTAEPMRLDDKIQAEEAPQKST